ncbi:MAG: hypothetical protein K2M00_08135 [Muribaculaceae bacterium]|nr:hypothetical protein [Muribaculaceae bacterium]
MKNLRYLLSAMTLVTATAAWAAPAKITASIDSTVVEMGSHAMITVNVVDPSHSGHVVDLPEDGTDAEAFDFVKVESDTTPTGYTYNLKIQAWYPGVLTLAPFKYATGIDTAESDVLTLKILPVEMDSTQQLNPMEGVVNMPSRWYDFIPGWSLWVLLGLAGLALVAGIIYLWLLYRRTGSIIPYKPKPVDPYAEAIEALKQLRSRRLAESGKEKEYYTALIDILRVYLYRRFAINAMEMSSTQILDSLRRNPETKGDQPRIKQILDLADIVKFAKVRPMPDDNIKSFNTVEQFVEATKPAPAPEEEDKNNKNKNK